MKTQEYVDALVSELRSHGVSDWSVDWAHNHPRLSFAWEGGVITHTMPGSPSDRFSGIERSVSDLRRRMGVKRVILPKSAGPAKPRKRTFVSLAGLPDVFTVRADPMMALAAVKDRLEEALARAVVDARWLGRFAFHAGLCGVAPDGYAPHLAKAYRAGWYDGVWGNR